jgi:hypothetical protein
MSERIHDRINDSFDGKDKEQTFQFMDWMRATILDYGQSIRRNATIMILLVAVFELIVSSSNTAISIGSFKIARGSIALVFLPAITSFLFLQIILDTQKVGRLIDAFNKVFKIWFPKAAEKGLNHLLVGPQAFYWSAFSPASQLDYKLDTGEFVASFLVLIATGLGLTAFEGQAYYVLFPVHSSDIVAWVISLLIALFCLCLSIFFIVVDAGM